MSFYFDVLMFDHRSKTIRCRRGQVAKLDQLENSQFLDDSTRLVVTLINAYNPHLQVREWSFFENPEKRSQSIGDLDKQKCWYSSSRCHEARVIRAIAGIFGEGLTFLFS